MINAIALVDLDDSLFQTLRKCPSHLSADELTLMAVDRDGAPLSFASREQAGFLSWLQKSALVIPVTGRSVDALQRVRINTDLAVAAYGGVILRGQAPCDIWHEKIAAKAEGCRPDLERIVASLTAMGANLQHAVRVRIIAEGGLPLYVVAKHGSTDGKDSELHVVAARIADVVPQGWTTHVNGNNVAYLPPHLGKDQAVKSLLPELRVTYPGVPIFGLGDSTTDAPFLQMCDFAMMPTRSQLANLLWRSVSGIAS